MYCENFKYANMYAHNHLEKRANTSNSNFSYIQGTEKWKLWNLNNVKNRKENTL